MQPKSSKPSFFRRLTAALRMELREHRSSFFVYVLLRAFVVLTAVLQLRNGNYENVFLCALTLFLLLVPSFVQLTLRVELPSALEIILLVFIFAAEILGEIQEFYMRIPFWDTILHTINGFLAAAIGFSLVELLNKSKRFTFQLSPLFTAIVALSFSMTIGVIWEFFEFAMDQFFGMDMQKDTIIHTIRSVALNPEGHNVPVVIDGITETVVQGRPLGVGGYLDIGLIDTMMDLLVNFVGAVVFSFLGYFYVKHRGKGSVVAHLIPRRKHASRDFLRMTEEETEEGK